MQLSLFAGRTVSPFKQQLLKWIGNKQRFAHEIVSYFPQDFGCYYEPFIGSGAVLGTLSPENAIASDAFGPLIEIWKELQSNPSSLVNWYATRWEQLMNGDKVSEYERIKASYNSNPNGADLLFLSRSCYGGVIRFRKQDGYMSTPCGPHRPISPDSFQKRVDIWAQRTSGAQFIHQDYRISLQNARSGDLVYCDPPYVHTQRILYGAQEFSFDRLLDEIVKCKDRGVYVALSIDGTKKSGSVDCQLPIPDGLFENAGTVSCGRSMLRRFQMNGQTLEEELVSDRLLLTY